MFEERDRTYKAGLIERIEPHVGKGERVQAVAVAQVDVPPRLQALPLVVGLVLIAVSLVAGAPGWVGIAGGLLVLAGIVAMSVAPRRLVARTNRAVMVFALPRSNSSAIEEPRATVPLDGLPAATGGGSVELGGERLWANYGSGIERDALAEVLAPK